VSEVASIPLLYHYHHSLNSDDLPFWLSWGRWQGGPILELGCGTGRVLLPLAEAGYTVFGLDYDPAMLNFLRDRITNSVRKRVMLIRSDMRSYCLSSRFPLILMPCNTYSTLKFTDRRIVLNRVRLHMSPIGVFIVSIPNPGMLSEMPEEGEPENEIVFSHPETTYPVQVSSQWEHMSGGVQFHWHYDHLLPDGRVERETISSLHYLQGFDEIMGDYTDAGLKIINTWGDFDSAPYKPESPYLIIIARC